MKYTSTALFIFACISRVKGDTACISDGAAFELDGCDYEAFENGLQDYLDDIGCEHDAKTELRRIYSNPGFAKQAIKAVCASGWNQVSSTSFTDVDSRFNNAFMNQYVSGDTFLNSKSFRCIASLHNT